MKKKTLNEQISRIKNVMKMIKENEFEPKNEFMGQYKVGDPVKDLVNMGEKLVGEIVKAYKNIKEALADNYPEQKSYRVGRNYTDMGKEIEERIHLIQNPEKNHYNDIKIMDGDMDSPCYVVDFTESDPKYPQVGFYLERELTPLTDDERDEWENREEDEGYCGSCNGSGEGMYDGSVCSSCAGTGVDKPTKWTPDYDDYYDGPDDDRY